MQVCGTMSQDKAVSFAVGEIFHSFEELQDKIDRLNNTNGVEFLKTDSKTITAARRYVGRPLSDSLKYYYVRYTCSQSSRNIKKKAAGDDSRAVGSEHGCKAYIHLLASKDSDSLVVRSLNKEHNHDNLQMKEEIVKEETGEYGDAADLHMVCSDASEFDPSSVIELLLVDDDDELACQAFDDGVTATQRENNNDILGNIDTMDEITDVELKDEIEDAAATGCVVERLPNGTDSKGYKCGICWQTFDEEADVKCHMFTKHMCVNKEQSQTGEVQVVRIANLGVIQSPSMRELSANLPAFAEANDNDRSTADLKPDLGNSVPVSDTSDAESNQRLKDKKKTTGERSLRREWKLCSICGTMSRALHLHMRLHQCRSFECTECGRQFSRKDYLVEHRRSHSEERPFLCGKCGRSFQRSNNLRAHLQTHLDERPFQCKQCGKCFRRSSGRAEHIRHVHERVKSHRCQNCPRTFSTAKGLRVHVMAGHTHERPHSCPLCAKQFRTTGVLKVHMATHSGERRFACSICGRRFTQSSAARVHERTQHSVDGGRCHACELCGLTFNKRSIRDAHVRRHQGIKPYACLVCSWTFAFAGDLRNHMIKKHKVKRNASAGRPQSDAVS